MVDVGDDLAAGRAVCVTAHCRQPHCGGLYFGFRDRLSAAAARRIPGHRARHPSPGRDQLREPLSADRASGRAGVARADRHSRCALSAATGRWSTAATSISPIRPATFVVTEPMRTPWVDQARIAREGIAIVCPRAEPGCVKELNAYVTRYGGKTEDVDARAPLLRFIRHAGRLSDRDHPPRERPSPLEPSRERVASCCRVPSGPCASVTRFALPFARNSPQNLSGTSAPARGGREEPSSVPVMIGLVRPVHRNADIV